MTMTIPEWNEQWLQVRADSGIKQSVSSPPSNRSDILPLTTEKPPSPWCILQIQGGVSLRGLALCLFSHASYLQFHPYKLSRDCLNYLPPYMWRQLHSGYLYQDKPMLKLGNIELCLTPGYPKQTRSIMLANQLQVSTGGDTSPLATFDVLHGGQQVV